MTLSEVKEQTLNDFDSLIETLWELKEAGFIEELSPYEIKKALLYEEIIISTSDKAKFNSNVKRFRSKFPNAEKKKPYVWGSQGNILTSIKFSLNSIDVNFWFYTSDPEEVPKRILSKNCHVEKQVSQQVEYRVVCNL